MRNHPPRHPTLGVADALRRTRFLVLDEADRMLEPTFESDMGTILEVLIN